VDWVCLCACACVCVCAAITKSLALFLFVQKFSIVRCCTVRESAYHHQVRRVADEEKGAHKCVLLRPPKLSRGEDF